MRADARERLARVGLASRGLLWGLMGLLALQIAFGSRSTQADSQGALRAVARQPFGRGLLALLAVGFAGYALWRFVQARRGDDWKQRTVAAVRGVVWAGLCGTTVRVVLGAGTGGSSEQSITARLMELPFGGALVAVAGVVVAGAGLWQGKQAFTGEWAQDLDLSSLGPTRRRAVAAAAVGGLVARMVVYALVGAFLVRAAVGHDPRRGVGLDGTLQQVAASPYGPWVLSLVAAGLAAFALWSLVRARYERIRV